MTDRTMSSEGKKVSLDVKWPNGQVSRMTGELIIIKDGEAYVKTNLGNVVGDVETMDYEDDEATED